MKLIINEDKFITDNDYLSIPYDVHCEMTLDEESTAEQCLKFFYRAMEIQGYNKECIKQAFKEFVENDFD